MEERYNSEVTVVDVKMPFWSMVFFMVKCSIAAIPAIIILVFVWIAMAWLLHAFGSGLIDL